MGREVLRLAREAGHEIVVEIDSASALGAGPLPAGLESADVAIDFTRADAVPRSVPRLAEAGVSMVVGTTGWYERLDEVLTAVRSRNGSLVYGANFSIGAQVVLRLVAEAASRLKDFPEYDPYVLEHHHRGKADTPSGTALRLASAILEAGGRPGGPGRPGRPGRKERLECGKLEKAIEPSALHVVGIRAGSAFGRHVVGFDGPADSIEISHAAKSREGFARGALFAAEWIRGRSGTFEFQELFERRST